MKHRAAPAHARKKHGDYDDKRRIRGNSLWNALQQVANLASGSIFSIALAVVLPLHEYGVYSYAITLTSVGLAITTAGLSGLGVKYIFAEGGASGKSVAAILIIRETFCVATYVLLGAISFTSNDNVTTIATLIALTALFFRALDAPELWYLAHLRSKRTATIRVTCVSTMLTIRVASMLLLPNLWLFIGLYVMEAVVTSLWILRRFLRDRDTPPMSRADRSYVGAMMRESSPLALSQIANQVNLRADVVIIQPMLGSAAVGLYALSTRASELAYFLPVVIMNSTLPVLLNALEQGRRSGDNTKYRRMLQVAYDRAFQGGLLVALAVSAVCLSPARQLVPDHLEPVFDILLIQIWASPFVFIGAVYSKWIIAEGYLWSSLLRHSIGAVANVGLVFLLIDPLGLRGAAIATVLSYAVSNYIACFFGSQSRSQGYAMTRAFASPIVLLVSAIVRFSRSATRIRRR
jgi:O-antigen/teichoic acid export membrane protein